MSGPREQAMSSGGLSKARLGRMHEIMAGHVERGGVPGLVALVGRRDEVHVDAIGMKAAGGREPMRRDTIFRIASLTKPVTAAAAMILVEEAKLRLDDPVDRWLPELADRKVLRAIDGPLDDTVLAKRAITLRDLLTFRLGHGAVMVYPERYPIQQAMAEAGIAPGPSLPAFPADELMTTDHITAEQKAASPFFPDFWDSRGWGFGLSVITRRDDLAAVPGRFGWDGGYGTSAYMDPKEDMVAILMTQRLWEAPRGPDVCRDFWTSIYQAIDD